MAGFHTKTFTQHDDYMTPLSAWDAIKHLLPKDKVLWEAFYGNGQSLQYLQELGFTAVGGEDEDFFEHNRGDVLVSNPPFTLIPSILQRIIDLDKPFVMIMPSSKINTQYFRKLLSERRIQIIIPRKRIQFEKIIDGKKSDKRSVCNFDCFYYCYKMNLERDIIWLK
jgi:hypothetical protein